MKNVQRYMYTSIGGAVAMAPSLTNAAQLQNPLGADPENANIAIILARLINISLGLVGVIALGIFVYGGFLFLISAGNDEKVDQGRKTLTWAAIGLLVIFSSYGVVNFIFESLDEAAGN